MMNQILLSYSRSQQVFDLYLLLINLLGFALMGIDKYKAKIEKWRTKESTLMTMSLVGGSAGVVIGMVVFKHKINKKKFYIGVPLLYIFNVIIKRIIMFYI